MTGQNRSSAVMQQRVDPPAAETRFLWIPPCRAALERHGDYDGYDVAPGARPGAPNGELFG